MAQEIGEAKALVGGFFACVMSINQAIRVSIPHGDTFTSALKINSSPKNFSISPELKVAPHFTSTVVGGSTLHYAKFSTSLPSAALAAAAPPSVPLPLPLPLFPARLFGPESRGGLAEAPAFERVRVEPGQNLSDVAIKNRSSAHEIAAASALPHFFVAPHQTVLVPGPRLRVEPEFNEAANYYKSEFQTFESRVETDRSLDPATRPDLLGTRLTSSANYQNVFTPQGAALKSTHIELDRSRAQLRSALAEAFNAGEALAPPNPKHSVEPVVRQPRGSSHDTSNFGLRIEENGMRLEPLRVELDPDQARQQEEAAQRHSEALYGKGRKDEMTLAENRWNSAFSNNSARLYDALSLSAGAVGRHDMQRWAEGKRVHHEHQAALADDRAYLQGNVTHSSQIESAADALTWLTGHAQQIVPPLLTMAPGAVLGGVGLGTYLGLGARTGAKLGGVAFSYPHSVGSMANAQRQHNGSTNAASAFGLGVLHAGVNYFGLEGALMGAQPFRSSWLSLDGLQGVVGGVTRAAGTGTKVASKEGLTEVSQTLTEQLGVTTVDPGETFWNAQSQANAIEAALAGTALGFVGGSGFGGWRRSGKPVAAPAQATPSAPPSNAWHTWVNRLWPQGGVRLWPEVGTHPAALFNLMTPQAYSYVVPNVNQGFAVQPRAGAADTWHRLSPSERGARQQHVMDVLMDAPTLTHHFLLDRLSGMQYKNIAQRHGVSEKQVQIALNGLANRLNKQKVKGEVSNILEQQLGGVLQPEQTAIGLAYVLTHHFDDLAATHYGHSPVIQLENTKINLNQAKALKSALEVFDPATGKLSMLEKPSESSSYSEALKKLNLRSLNDAQRRYPKGVEGLKEAVDRYLEKVTQIPTQAQKKRDDVLSVLMSQDDRSLKQIYMYLNGVERKNIAAETGVRTAEVRQTIHGVAARLNVDKGDLNTHLSHVFVEGESGLQLLDRIVNRFDDFSANVLADQPVLPLTSIRPSALDIAVIEGSLNQVDSKVLAQQLGTTVEAIRTKKSRFVQTVRAYSLEDYTRRYPGSEQALREHIQQIKDAHFDPSKVLDEDYVQRASNGNGHAAEIPSAPAHTPLQRVLNTLMWARTPVLEDLLAYLNWRKGTPHLPLTADIAKEIAVHHGVSRNVLVSDLAVLVDRMRGSKLDESNVKKIEALEGLLSDVLEPGQTPIQFVQMLLDDVGTFSSKYFGHHPIKKLDAAELTSQELLYLKKALDDPEFSWAFQNASAVSMFEDVTFNQVLRKFNALSISDLMRRYPNHLEGLIADVNLRVKTLGLDVDGYRQATQWIAANDLDFVGAGLHTINSRGNGHAANGYLDTLLAGTVNQVTGVLAARKTVDPRIVERDLSPVLSAKQQHVLEVLMQERTLVFNQLLKVMEGDSFNKVGDADGVQASTVKDLFQKLSKKISGNADAKSADVRFLLPEIFGSAQSAKTFVELLAYDFGALAQRYLADRPIKSIREANLSSEQKNLLRNALANQELLWSFQSRGSDAVVEALGGYSIHDVLRRYVGGLDQLRIDLGLPPLSANALSPESNRAALEWAAVKDKVIDSLPRMNLKDLNVNYRKRIGRGGKTNVYALKDRPDVVLSILRTHDFTRLEEYKYFLEFTNRESMKDGFTLLQEELRSFDPQEIVEKAAYTHHVFSSGLHYKGHPLAPQVYGIVEKDGLAIGYLMEKIEGKTLNDESMSPGFSQERYDDVEVEAMRQLDLLIEHGFIHRDMDPMNMILSTDQDGNDIVRLIDFDAPTASPD